MNDEEKVAFVKYINAKIKKYEMFEDTKNDIKFVDSGTSIHGDELFDLVMYDEMIIKVAYYNNTRFALQGVGSAYSSTYWSTMEHLIEICNNYFKRYKQ